MRHRCEYALILRPSLVIARGFYTEALLPLINLLTVASCTVGLNWRRRRTVLERCGTTALPSDVSSAFGDSLDFAALAANFVTKVCQEQGGSPTRCQILHGTVLQVSQYGKYQNEVMVSFDMAKRNLRKHSLFKPSLQDLLQRATKQ